MYIVFDVLIVVRVVFVFGFESIDILVVLFYVEVKNEI